MADCQETLNEMYAYLDAELASERATEIIGHLKVCTDCQSAYEFHAEFKTIIRMKAPKRPAFRGLPRPFARVLR